MPETDYRPDEESEELARKLASSTIEDLRGLRESSRDPDAPTVSLEMHAGQLGIDAPLRDVTFVMQEFAWQWELAQELDGRMPCVQIGDGEQAETIPLSLTFDFPFPHFFRSWRWAQRFYPFPPEFFLETYQDLLRSRGEREGISIEPADNVLERLRNGLGSFLAYRLAGYRAWLGWTKGKGGQGRSGSGGAPPPASVSPGGGLGVEVWCNTPGLTIEFSHAYFIHFLNFGAPSFPVKNTLLAGRYVFQGKGPTYPSGTARSQVFRIPPDYKAVTTYF